MKTYSLSTEHIETQHSNSRKLGIGCVSLGVIALLINMLIVLAGSIQFREIWWLYLAAILVVLIVFGAVAFWFVRRQRTAAVSLEFELGADYILKRHQSRQEERLERHEVTQLHELDAGLLLMSEGRRKLLVPDGLEGYDELKGELVKWADIQPVDQPPSAGLIRQGITAIFIAGIFTMYTAREMWLVIVSGVAVLAFFVYRFWELGRDPSATPLRRGVNLLLVVVIVLFVANRIYLFSIGALP